MVGRDQLIQGQQPNNSICNQHPRVDRPREIELAFQVFGLSLYQPHPPYFLKAQYALALLGLVLIPGEARPISAYAESFTTPSSNTWSFGSGVPINTSPWSTYTNGNHGSRITNGRLEVTNRRSSSAHGQGFAYVACGGPGSQYDNAVYNPVLGANGALITWTFNMRKSPSNATTNGGFDCSSSANQNGRTIGLGYILATNSASGILSATNNCNPNGTSIGYAVLHGGTNRIRLVRFENGIHNGSITNIAESQTVNYANYHSIRVTYDPTTDTWTLAVRSDGTGSFADPSAGSYPSTATGVDGTHTGVALNFTGGYFQAGCIGNCDDASSGYIALFDNVNVDVACVPPAAPGAIAGIALVCPSDEGSYSIDEVVGVTDYAWTYSGTDVTLDQVGTTVTITFGSNATSGMLSVVSVGECNSSASTLDIVVQGLPLAPGGLAGPLVICAGEEATFSVDPVGGETYDWTLPTAWSGDAEGDSIDVIVAAPGGTLTIVGANSCGEGPAASIEVTVVPLPDVTLDEFALLCLSAPPLSLTGGAPAGGTYTFNGVPITSFDPVVGLGSYPIEYTVVDTNGCSASAMQVLEVDACAGIAEHSVLDVRVHPNPASGGVLYVHAPSPGSLTLHDPTGRIAGQASYGAQQGRSTLSVQGLSAGTYVLVFQAISGEFGHTRIVITD